MSRLPTLQAGNGRKVKSQKNAKFFPIKFATFEFALFSLCERRVRAVKSYEPPQIDCISILLRNHISAPFPTYHCVVR